VPADGGRFADMTNQCQITLVDGNTVVIDGAFERVVANLNVGKDMRLMESDGHPIAVKPDHVVTVRPLNLPMIGSA
jgi:hypothetical protein